MENEREHGGNGYKKNRGTHPNAREKKELRRTKGPGKWKMKVGMSQQFEKKKKELAKLAEETRRVPGERECESMLNTTGGWQKAN